VTSRRDFCRSGIWRVVPAHYYIGAGRKDTHCFLREPDCRAQRLIHGHSAGRHWQISAQPSLSDFTTRLATPSSYRGAFSHSRFSPPSLNRAALPRGATSARSRSARLSHSSFIHQSTSCLHPSSVVLSYVCNTHALAILRSAAEMRIACLQFSPQVGDVE
jgi:hypothetical protein